MGWRLLASFILLAAVGRLPAAEGSECSYICYRRYTTNCGLWGWRRCTRTRSATCYGCCTGWTGSSCNTPLCSGLTSCPNGGSCSSPNNCINCNRGYYSPRCLRCTQIPNCLEEHCSTSSDQECDRCDGDYGSTLGSAYKKSDDQRQCIKQCSWRADSSACYPGSCTDGQCSCSSGFTGTDCRTLETSQSPVLSEHLATLTIDHTTLESPLGQYNTDTVYTNVRNFESLRVNWKFSYQPTGLPDPDAPYIQSASLGVVAARATAVVIRGSFTVYSFGQYVCSTSSTGTAFSHSAPAKDLVICEHTFDIATWIPATGDVLRISYSVTNGGFLRLYNRDASNAIITRHYSGQTASAHASFTYDFVEPHHCLGESGGCRTGMLDPGDNVVTQADLLVYWDGWEDNLAGVKEYHLEVRQLLGSHGDQMTEIFNTPAVYSAVTTSGQNVTLPHIGVYSVLLSVVDNADNVRRSRRFVFFDDDPDDVSIEVDSPLSVPSASPTATSGQLWQTDLALGGAATAVELDWAGHFANHAHHSQGLLKPIGTYGSGNIDSDYDQNFGQRGRAEVPNALGITQFLVWHGVDHSGGRTVANPNEDQAADWRDEANRTAATYWPVLADGDSVRFWLEARDLAGHQRRDSLLLHVDASPPVLEGLALARDGEVDLVLHSTDQLQDMRVVFKAYDIHSGVRTIEWHVFENYTGSEVDIGRQTVPARKINTDEEDCDPGACVCIPIGDCYATDYEFQPPFHVGTHDSDYFITLTIANHAGLVTTQTIQITIDTSPPQAGTVLDGLPGTSDEVDYQGGNALRARWSGFFDRESGVMFYEYAFDEACLSPEDVRNRNMMRTTLTHAGWTAPSAGRYHATVVAYNRALEPSGPVCSDGVTIDASPPQLEGMVLAEARVWPGVARDGQGRVWLIDNQRRRAELVQPSSSCRTKATLLEDISIYPDAPLQGNQSLLLGDDPNCEWIASFQERLFLAAHKHLTLSWTGVDEESAILDYQVGLSGDGADLTPDLVPFQSTAGRPHAVLYHPLISHGSVFHLVLRAINRAQFTTTKVIGPIIVDTTPPLFHEEIRVSLQGDYLTARWMAGEIEDTGLACQVAVGSSDGGTETLGYRRERDYALGPCWGQRFCAAFPLEGLEGWRIHAEHVYYVSVQAVNGAGLSSVATSGAYRHGLGLPAVGVVLDVAPPPERTQVAFGIAKDIDVQTSTSSICAHWYGFERPLLPLRYEIAVGSSPASPDDVSEGFVSVGLDKSYCLEPLSLSPLMTYYVTVCAISDAGSVNATSDGLKVIQLGQVLNGTTIKDGLGCDQENTTPQGLSHHSSAPLQSCEDDTTYQSSTTFLAVRWTIPELLRPYVTNVLWSLEQEIEIYSDQGGGDPRTEWVAVIEKQDLGMALQHVEAGIDLHDGGHYRSKVQLCHGDPCFSPITSDGFWVLSQPPQAGRVAQVEAEELASGQTRLWTAFQPFALDYAVPHRNPAAFMDRYEWSLSEAGGGVHNHAAIMTRWTTIEDFFVTGELIRFPVTYEGQLEQATCPQLLIRGYSKAGLWAVTAADILDCTDPERASPNLVIDADHEVILEQNARWPEPDRDYVSSATCLSAVWPTLRHRDYVWAALEDTGRQEFGDPRNGFPQPCDHPMAIACGQTDKEYVNVHGLFLEHGKRYRVCVHADNATLRFERWTQTLPSVSACSDGVLVDLTPPSPGAVWIGQEQHHMYQISRSELVIHWESFLDTEEHGLSKHHSGIKSYEYAIGSGRGGSDVVPFTAVGITNSVIVPNLRLQDGHTYYATIRAVDFVGLSAQASSDPVTIDASPPTVNSGHTLEIGGHFITSTMAVSASWENVFTDKESGVAYYEWAVGSEPGHADIMAFSRMDSEAGISDPSRPLNLQEGHSYYISVKAINTVGLVRLRSFGAFVVEASPPLANLVFDGRRSTEPSPHPDRDYQRDRGSLAAHWLPFSDPQSAVVGYTWRAGLCPGCDDVVPEQQVGLDLDAVASNLQLVAGLKYYVTVTACNAADLCTSASTDGVLVDDSPPLPGRVHHGMASDGPETGYQSSRLRVSAHWWGFHDPHSGLEGYEWGAGTAPGADDLLAFRPMPLAEHALRFLPEVAPLPLGSPVFVTVVAANPLGLRSQATSRGFRVDTSPPLLVRAPTVDATLGRAAHSTQVLRDLLHVTWEFSDPESGIRHQYLSLSTHHDGDVQISPLKIAGSELEHTFTQLALHDGSQYTVTVTACNLAGLCTEAKTEPLLIDGSPPSVGTFASASASAANLGRHDITWIVPTTVPTATEVQSYPTTPTPLPPPRYHSGWMTWLQAEGETEGSLALAWLGFEDAHSGISHYYLTVGHTYGGSELTPNGPVRVNHMDADTQLDGGISLTAIIPIEGSIIDSNQPYLFLSLWAVNGVGLPSRRHHATFEASPVSPHEGALVLLRRCMAATCEGHCACAPKDRACAPVQCNDVTYDNPHSEIEVLDVLDLSLEDIDGVVDMDFTPTQLMMAGVWRVTQQKGLDIKWYEYSIGDDSSSDVEPVGVFDPVTERIWFDIGQDDHAVIVFDQDKKLTEGVRYHLFVRAWYDTNTYAVFRSNGITVDVMPPQITTIWGRKVKDLPSADSGTDTDYLTEPEVVHVSWEGVFLDAEAPVTHYEVSLSSHPGGEDICQFVDHVFPAPVSFASFSGLSLETGLRYYANVRAFNQAQLHSLRSSDGFVVDTRKPQPGLVLDGADAHDVEYQNSSTLVAASWHGFVDLDSAIHHYEWCVGESVAPEDDAVLPRRDVGIAIAASARVPVPLEDGIKYYSKITAVDAAGWRSVSVSSDGFVVDTTPPETLEHISLGDNLIENPSFEETEGQSNTESRLLQGWEVAEDGASRAAVVNASKKSAQDGRSYLALHGALSQSVPTAAGVHYAVTVHAARLVQPSSSSGGGSGDHPPSQPLNQEGLITAPGLRRVFRLHDPPAQGGSEDGQNRSPGTAVAWQELRFYFTAGEDTSTLTISSLGHSGGLLLDNVQVREISVGLSDGDGAVQVHAQHSHSWSSLQARWAFVDPESPIVDYAWAIGTVRGGTQLQGYRSVGTQTEATNTALHLPHGALVHVTVLARNAAGLTALATSPPVRIDLTPPVIHYVKDGTEEDIDFSPDDSSLTFSWSASDPESGIDHCEWAVGSQPGLDDVLPSEVTPHSTLSLTRSLPAAAALQARRLFVLVTCRNRAGHSAWAASDGLTLVTEPPSALAAGVHVKVVSETQYGARDGYQSQQHGLRASWEGFRDPFGIHHYECMLSGPGFVGLGWQRCGTEWESHLDWTGLGLQDGATYSLSVRAVNQAQLASLPVSHNITLESSRPVMSADLNLITSTWHGDGVVDLAWPGLFHSSSPLVYELSLGSRPGAADVLQWVETAKAGLEVSPLAPHTDYYLTLTAVNAAGLSETANKIIHN